VLHVAYRNEFEDPERDLQAAAQGIPGRRPDDRDRDLRPDVRGALLGRLGRPVARRQPGLEAEPLTVDYDS
jgi:hypothetical protein